MGFTALSALGSQLGHLRFRKNTCGSVRSALREVAFTLKAMFMFHCSLGSNRCHCCFSGERMMLNSALRAPASWL